MSEAAPAFSRPVPRPDAVSQGFWDATSRGQLAIQRCQACRSFQHPPRLLCRACGGAELAFEPVSGKAQLVSWTVTHHNVLPGFAAALPYTCIVAELIEQPGLYLLSDLVGRERDFGALARGLPLHVVFPDPGGDAPVLPQFAPAEAPR